jgi:hypothetical protein
MNPAVHWVLKAVQSGLQLALLAPPVAAVLFTAFLVVSNSASPRPEQLGAASVSGLLFASLLSTYFLGGISAFVGGLALRPIAQLLPPLPTSCLVGGIVLAVYSLTFGAHLASGTKGIVWYLPYAIPAFLGGAVPAYYLARRIEA